MQRQEFKYKGIAAALFLAFAGQGYAAEAAPVSKKKPKRPGAAASNQELQRKLDELQKTVDELRQQVKASPEKGSGSTVAGADGKAATTAQETATKSDVEGLRADLENYKYAQQRDRERKTALTTRGTTLFGTVQVRGSWESPSVKSNTNAVADKRHSSFDVPLVQLGLRGSLFRDYSEGRNLDYQVLFGYTPNVASGTSLQTTAANGSQFNLLDAYVNYSFLPTVTGLEEDKATLRFGQQLIPYGLEAQVGEDLRPTINVAQFLTGGAITKNAQGVPVGVNGHGVGVRQIGLVFRGDTHPYVDYTANYRAPLFEYALGVLNGSTTNKSDDNGHKDYIGRVAFTLPVDYSSWLRELKFGTSFYKGERNITAASTVGGSQSFRKVGRNDRYGFDVYYNHNPFGVSYEYSEGRDEAIADRTLAQSTIKSRGQYLTFYGQWGEQFLTSIKSQGKYDDFWPNSQQIFLRFDRFDPNVDLVRNEIWTTTAGLNLFFAETTKFQVNLLHTNYRDRSLKDSNALLAQFQYGF
jgi:hypothetical protein